MNRKNAYIWFWKDLLHLPRPITHILRDWFTWPLPLLFIPVGIVIGHYLPHLIEWWWIVISLIIGILLGHVFWSAHWEEKVH